MLQHVAQLSTNAPKPLHLIDPRKAGLVLVRHPPAGSATAVPATPGFASTLSTPSQQAPLPELPRQPLTIGVLDSGVGGLTVVKQILKHLPTISIRYIGDSARCPYGVRDTEEIRRFTWQMIDHLRRQPLEALVIACNTATAVVLDDARRQLPFPVLGVIQPGADAAVAQAHIKRVALLATPATIRSGVHLEEIRKRRTDVEVLCLACPGFVSLVEAGSLDSPMARDRIRKTLEPVRAFRPQALILGCTHFPLIKQAIQEAVGEDVELIDPAEATARELASLLRPETSLEASSFLRPNRHTFYTTGSPLSFRAVGEQWLERGIRVRTCTLDDQPPAPSLEPTGWPPSRSGLHPISIRRLHVRAPEQNTPAAEVSAGMQRQGLAPA